MTVKGQLGHRISSLRDRSLTWKFGFSAIPTTEQRLKGIRSTGEVKRMRAMAWSGLVWSPFTNFDLAISCLYSLRTNPTNPFPP